MKHGSLLLCLVLAVGCATASSKAPSGPVSGTVTGSTFTAKGAVATRPAIDTCKHDFGTGPVLLLQIRLSESFDTVYLRDHPCDAKANSKDFAVYIWKLVDSGEITPGTYPRRDDSSGGMTVFQAKSDAACKQVLPNLQAESGAVTIETSDTMHVIGVLDVTFPGGGRLAGRFEAPVTPSRGSVCQSLGIPGGTDGPGCPTGRCIP